jgi:hypothetical protein
MAGRFAVAAEIRGIPEAKILELAKKNIENNDTLPHLEVVKACLPLTEHVLVETTDGMMLKAKPYGDDDVTWEPLG